MSVRPVQFNADGSIEVLHDEGNHGGTIPAAEVQWATKMDGSHDHSFIVLTCPFESCGSSSTHPVGGGAAPAEVQQMFVNKVQAEGCACGHVQAADANTLGESHVHLAVDRMDGPGRWQLT